MSRCTPSMSNQAGAAYLSAFGMADEALVWGRCQALAAKAMRNLAVSEPAALLQHKNAVPSLLAALIGPSGSQGGCTVEGSSQMINPAGLHDPTQQLLSPCPSPRPGGMPQLRPLLLTSMAFNPQVIPPVAWHAGREPAWMIEVQRNALAALVNLTAKQQALTACASVVETGGIPVIVEVGGESDDSGKSHEVTLRAFSKPD